MLQVQTEDIDRITETLFLILKGDRPAPVELPEGYPDNEIRQMVGYLNRLVTEYNQFSDALAGFSNGDLEMDLPKGQMIVLHSLKNLQANLKHLTWKTLKIADGDLSLKVDFLGDLSVAFNRMTEQLKEAFGKIEGMSLTDELTGIANRRNFNETLKREWSRAHRSGLPISLIMLDIDFFKFYNDHYGHQEGDLCLQKVALAVSRAAKRPTDLAARYGGEEFAVILPGTPLSGAEKVTGDIQDNITAARIPHEKSSVSRHVTASIGVAAMSPSPSDNYESLIKAADDLLYKAKENGRNRSETASL